jgi:hypothetical protein
MLKSHHACRKFDSSSGEAAQISNPVTFGAQQRLVQSLIHIADCSVTLSNSRIKFNIARRMSWLRTVHYLGEKDM